MAQELGAFPRRDLGRTEAFLSYRSLKEVNAVDPQRQFQYTHKRTYIPSATFHKRALILGIGESSKEICDELKRKGYIGLVEIEVISSREGVNRIRGKPVISVR